MVGDEIVNINGRRLRGLKLAAAKLVLEECEAVVDAVISRLVMLFSEHRYLSLTPSQIHAQLINSSAYAGVLYLCERFKYCASTSAHFLFPWWEEGKVARVGVACTSYLYYTGCSLNIVLFQRF